MRLVMSLYPWYCKNDSPLNPFSPREGFQKNGASRTILIRIIEMRPMSYRTLPDFYWGWLSNVNFNTLNTRIHSSRMRTVRSSGRRRGGGGLYPSKHWAGGVYPSMHWVGGVWPSACWDTHPRGQNDRRLWKYYLAATTLRTVKIPLVVFSSILLRWS